jgi:hypothetical protein
MYLLCILSQRRSIIFTGMAQAGNPMAHSKTSGVIVQNVQRQFRGALDISTFLCVEEMPVYGIYLTHKLGRIGLLLAGILLSRQK